MRVVGVDLPEHDAAGQTGAVLCAFGGVDAASPAAFVSSALAACESPDAAGGGGGAFQLRLVTEGGEAWTADEGAATLEVVPSTRAAGVAPAAGWDVGGITVSVAVVGDGAELTQASFPPFACQFGSLAPVAARAAGPDAMLCVAPAAGARRAAGGASRRGSWAPRAARRRSRTAARRASSPPRPRWRPRSATARR